MLDFRRRVDPQLSVQKYSEFVNPKWVKLLGLLQMNTHYVHCEGVELKGLDGNTYLDFLSGYGVYNVGHSHPYIKQKLIEEIEGFGANMLQTHIPDIAGELAERLCQLAGGDLKRVFFTSTGSEGVETAIKFSRAYTRRDGVLYGQGGFHGLTCGALSLMSNSWWRDRFGSMLEHTRGVPFNDLKTLEEALKTKKFAAYIVEPIQGESGIITPLDGYLKRAEELCRRYGTLFVLDEVQTGFYRTGKFIAAHHYDVSPDMVILAKAMSGSYVPVGAVLMRKEISDSVYRSVEKSFVHASTFGENGLAMRAAMATLDVLIEENLGDRAIKSGERLRSGLRKIGEKYQMFKAVRGEGLFNGIEFQVPKSLTLRALFEGFSLLHSGLFGQMVVRHLYHQGKTLTQMCGNQFMVVKAIPPLIISESQIDYFVSSVDALFDEIENKRVGFWKQGFQIGKEALS